MTSISDLVKDAIEEAIQKGNINPKVYLSECDLQCMIYSLLVSSRHYLEEYSVHTEIPFLDEHGALSLKPDITILKSNEILMGTGALSRRKGFTAFGSSSVIEIKFYKGVANISEQDCLSDIDKLSNIKELHYEDVNERYDYKPSFVLYSRNRIDDELLARISSSAIENGVLFYHSNI